MMHRKLEKWKKIDLKWKYDTQKNVKNVKKKDYKWKYDTQKNEKM